MKLDIGDIIFSKLYGYGKIEKENKTNKQFPLQARFVLKNEFNKTVKADYSINGSLPFQDHDAVKVTHFDEIIVRNSTSDAWEIVKYKRDLLKRLPGRTGFTRIAEDVDGKQYQFWWPNEAKIFESLNQPPRLKKPKQVKLPKSIDYEIFDGSKFECLPKRIHFMRHFETANNLLNHTQQDDSELDLNFKQIRIDELRKQMNDLGIVHYALINSNLKRAKDSSAILRNKAVYVLDTNLIKEVNFGDYAGLPVGCKVNNKLLSDYNDAIKNDSYFKFPNGESSEMIKERIDEFVEVLGQLLRTTDATDVIIVTHNRFMRHLFAELGLVKHKDMFKLTFDHGKLITFKLK